MLDCGFDSPTCNGALWDVYKGAAKTTQLADATVSPPHALVSSLIYPSLTGGMELIYPANSAAAKSFKELYVALRWRTNSGFEGNRPAGNKLFFVRAHNWVFGGTGTNGYFGMFGPANTFPMRIGFGHNTGPLDNSHTCQLDKGLLCNPNVATTPIYPGQWYTIETYVKASSCETCRDGIVRWWVNGTLNGNYTNMNYGTGVVNEWVWANTWDGTPNGNGCCATRDWHHYVDHILIKATAGMQLGIKSRNSNHPLSPERRLLNLIPGAKKIVFRPLRTGSYSVCVFNLSGREMWRYSGTQEAIWSHGENLKRGVYLVRAEQNGTIVNTSYCHIQ